MKSKNKNLTQYSKLSQYFKGSKPNVPKKDEDNVILKTRDKDEYDRVKMQRKQDRFLAKQFKVVQAHIKERSLVYESVRIPLYFDYDLMVQYPIIGKALKIIAEEATTVNEHNKVLNIFSESDRVQQELTDLFYNRLNIHTNLVMWIYNMCKYGDNFLHLQMDSVNGITGVAQLPNIDMERIDGSYLNTFSTSDSLEPDEVLFRYRGGSRKEFKEWQIAHFRLIMDDRRLPYGMSMLEDSRRIWKNILLAEDAMRAVRLLNAIDRRIYYIDVGNIHPDDVDQYMDGVASRFRRVRHVDPNTGQEDLKYNVIEMDQSLFIPKRGDRDITKVDTLQGSTNLDQIADIEYDFKQLFAALGVPKSFLNYEETAGDGKNLSMQDIRFARTINRIQQAALQELNKIALTHLFLLGFEDELHNFELSLNNPSLQTEIMRTELLQSQITAFKDSVSDAGNGIAVMSHTMAWKKIFNLSADEIRENLEQQYFEKAAANEIANSVNVIKETTIFNRVKKLYGDLATLDSTGTTEVMLGDEGGGGDFGGGGSFGGDFGGGEELGGEGDLDFGDEGLEGETEGGGEPEAGGEAEGGGEPEGVEESVERDKDLILENKLNKYLKKINAKMKKLK